MMTMSKHENQQEEESGANAGEYNGPQGYKWSKEKWRMGVEFENKWT